jgi:hypothetical protein
VVLTEPWFLNAFKNIELHVVRMHLPSAVSYPVKRSPWHLLAILLLWSSCLLAAFIFNTQQSSRMANGLLWGIPNVLLAVGLWQWFYSANGLIQWNGQTWQWSDTQGTYVCELIFVLDFQNFVLLQLHSTQQKSRHLWLQGKATDRQWRALRRAIVASNEASTEQPAGAHPITQAPPTQHVATANTPAKPKHNTNVKNSLEME